MARNRRDRRKYERQVIKDAMRDRAFIQKLKDSGADIHQAYRYLGRQGYEHEMAARVVGEVYGFIKKKEE